MILAENILSAKQLRRKTGHKFCEYIPIGKIVDDGGSPSVLGGFRRASLASNLPSGPYKGLYIVSVGIHGKKIPIYCGMRYSIKSLRHRISCEFYIAQNEGGKSGKMQGPSCVWHTLKNCIVDAEYYVSYVRLDGLSEEQVAKEEKKILTKIDFIANDANNGNRRMSDLVGIVNSVAAVPEEVKAAEAVPEEAKAIENIEEKPKSFADALKCLDGFDEHISRIRALSSFSPL